MSKATNLHVEFGIESVRVLGRGLRAQRGVHLTLRTLRKGTGKTQVDIANASQIKRPDISRLENRESFEDCQVSTLQRYVEALGGRLELVAAFGDKRIILTGVAAERKPRGARTGAPRLDAS